MIWTRRVPQGLARRISMPVLLDRPTISYYTSAISPDKACLAFLPRLLSSPCVFRRYSVQDYIILIWVGRTEGWHLVTTRSSLKIASCSVFPIGIFFLFAWCVSQPLICTDSKGTYYVKGFIDEGELLALWRISIQISENTLYYSHSELLVLS